MTSTTPSQTPVSPRASALVIILAIIFLDVLGIGILIPVIPQLLANPASPQYLLPAGWSPNQGVFLLGVLTAVYPLAQFFASPILGQLSDKLGRRPVLITSLAGTAAGYILFALGIVWANLPLLFASRILDGLTGGNISVAQAAVADITPPDRRARNFGLMGMIFGFGFIIGPFLGGVLADSNLVSWFNASTPFWFAAILSTLNVLAITLFLPETHPQPSGEPMDWAKSIHHIVKAVTHPTLRTLFLVGFLLSSGFSFFFTLFNVYLIRRFGFGEAQIGHVFAYIGLWIALTQGLLTPVVTRKWKERQILPITLTGAGLGILLYLLPGPWWILLLVTPPFAMMNGLTMANYMALLSRFAGRESQGEVLGISASVQALAQAVPPMIAAWIASRLGVESSAWIGSLLALSAAGVFIVGVRRQPVPEAPVPQAAAA